MRRVFGILVATIAAVVAVAAGEPGSPRLDGRIYRLDGAHSHVEFSVRYLKLMEVKGRFRQWDAAILNPEDPSRGAIVVLFRTASLDTGNETRDAHLKSADFFDAETHPAAVFASDRIERDGGAWIAHGELDLHGVRRRIAVPFRVAYPPTTDGKGNARVGFVGEVTIDRNDFGVVGGNRFNSGFDPRVSIIDDEVRIGFGIHGTVAPIRSAAVDSVIDAVAARGVAGVVQEWNAAAPTGDGDESERARARAAAIHNAAGYRLMETGRHDDAVELLRLAVLGAPGSARAVTGLAEGYARAGRLEAARENVERALEIDPYETRALVLRAWLESD